MNSPNRCTVRNNPTANPSRPRPRRLGTSMSVERLSRTAPSPTPSKMKTISANVIVVLAVTTDAMPSTKGTLWRLSRYAFIGSPPRYMPGVV